MTFKHCNNCQTYTTCLEQGCGQVREIRASSGDEFEAERVLKQALAELHVMYQRQAQPILAQLARIEAMKMPRPVFVMGHWHQFRPEVFEGITGKPAPAVEDPGQRMRCLEEERGQAFKLLRMFKAAGCVPDYLAAEMAYILEHLDP